MQLIEPAQGVVLLMKPYFIFALLKISFDYFLTSQIQMVINVGIFSHNVPWGDHF